MTLKAFLSITLITILFSGCKTQDSCSIPGSGINPGFIEKTQTDFNPEKYVCYKTSEITIDGVLDEPSWIASGWTSDFVDIEGDLKPAPLHRTRAKMLWDNRYLYIAAEIYEPHIWAKLTRRDTVIFYDNDFEVFIDPDGDTHGYYEFEMNANNILWDLLLTRPYRDYGQVINAWDINGIKTAVKVHGTLNNPNDTDTKWVIELAFPLSVLKEWGNMPDENVQWRINFSRVNWRTVIENNNYVKEINPETGRRYPEFNWVWSPQGVINMHYPETWGYIQFTLTEAGQGVIAFVEKDDEKVKWNLRTLYYAERNFATDNKHYTTTCRNLYKYGYEKFESAPCIILTTEGYEAVMQSPFTNIFWKIDNTGKIIPLPRN